MRTLSLQDSLGGNAATVVLATISAAGKVANIASTPPGKLLKRRLCSSFILWCTGTITETSCP